jgi:D-alanyl-D-alanine carboxypeptidase
VTKGSCRPSRRSVIMRTTKRRTLRQARAVPVRGRAPGSPAGRTVRAVLAATTLAVVASLSPELTQAPIQADEPSTPVADVATSVSQSVPLTGVAPQQEPALPPARPDRGARPAAAVGASRARQFQAALDGARYAGLAYGVTFAAVRDGELIWSGSSGVARDGRTPLSPDSTMVVGSVAKTFVAAAILQLVEEGELQLDDAVRSHLPDVVQVTREITIRQLLDHTSGLADVFNETTRLGLERHPEQAWSAQRVLATLHGPWYQPGEGWAYANTNYLLLGMIIERVTGSTLEKELERRFLEPLAMDRTHSLVPGDPASPLPPAWVTIFWASGAMTSSASDLARWGDALYDDDLPELSLLDADLRRDMVRFNRDDYGLGVKRIELKRRTAYGHTGLLNTYTTLLLHLPEDDVTVAMLVNRTHVDLLSMLRERPAFGGPSLLSLAVES